MRKAKIGHRCILNGIMITPGIANSNRPPRKWGSRREDTVGGVNVDAPQATHRDRE